jgi:hypothetical protein
MNTETKSIHLNMDKILFLISELKGKIKSLLEEFTNDELLMVKSIFSKLIY